MHTTCYKVCVSAVPVIARFVPFALKTANFGDAATTLAPRCATRPSPSYCLTLCPARVPQPHHLSRLCLSRCLAVLPCAALISLRLGLLCASCVSLPACGHRSLLCLYLSLLTRISYPLVRSLRARWIRRIPFDPILYISGPRMPCFLMYFKALSLWNREAGNKHLRAVARHHCLLPPCDSS
ncbi:hypothetical protein BJV78DRAFT_174851 [Lactifluus subvellereus]|nr:hypothetical protein BJV78DRAFT_174851 [Lactifluus subvellereus]